MRKISMVAGLLAGYAGYRFITRAFKLTKDNDPMTAVGRGLAGLGFGGTLMGMTAPVVDMVIDTFDETINEHKCCGECIHEDPIEQGMNAAADNKKENEDE